MTAAAIAVAVIAALATGCRSAPRPEVIENRVYAAAPARVHHGAITEASVAALLGERFAPQVAAGTFAITWNGTSADVLAELAALHIDDLAELAAMIPADYDHRASAEFVVGDPANIPGVLRDIFIITDARRYFRDAWQSHWDVLSEDNLPLYRAYHVDLQILVDAKVIDARAIAASSP